MKITPEHNPTGLMLLRLFCCEAMVAAVCLVILSRSVWGFIMSFEYLSFTQMNDMSVYSHVTFEILPIYARAIIMAVGSLMAVLLASTINVSLFKNNSARNLVRTYLVAMFVLIIIDLLLLMAYAYVCWTRFFSND